MCVVLLSVRMQAQSSNARLTMEIRNATLESLVKRLENSTGFTFVYGEEVRLNSRISLQVKQLTISELLEQAFRDQPVEFSINGKHIVLRKREMPKKRNAADSPSAVASPSRGRQRPSSAPTSPKADMPPAPRPTPSASTR